MKIILLLSFAYFSLFADSFESMTNNINKAKDPILKQILTCERDAAFAIETANPNTCLKVVDMLYGIDKPSNELAEFITFSTHSGIRPNDPEFENLLTRYSKKMEGESYFNAGRIYQFGKKFHNTYKAFDCYKKSYDSGYCELGPECRVGDALGVLYAKEQDAAGMNSYKAIRYFKEAAKHGNQNAKNNLEYMCKQYPQYCD